ncbi:MAG TPA: hypothetical protein VK081_01030 [Planctomycetota bacterium]|nr:hypothetical protein [Planctomycetota bacterium]
MKKAFRDLFHRYKVESFKVSHSHDSVEEITKEILSFTEEALNNAYHFHFHQDPDPSRIETFNMIKHYTMEALLPPVVEKLTRRLVTLEKQHHALVKLVGDLLEVLSDERAEHGDVRVG